MSRVLSIQVVTDTADGWLAWFHNGVQFVRVVLEAWFRQWLSRWFLAAKSEPFLQRMEQRFAAFSGTLTGGIATLLLQRGAWAELSLNDGDL